MCTLGYSETPSCRRPHSDAACPWNSNAPGMLHLHQTTQCIWPDCPATLLAMLPLQPLHDPRPLARELRRLVATVLQQAAFLRRRRLRPAAAPTARVAERVWQGRALLAARVAQARHLRDRDVPHRARLLRQRAGPPRALRPHGAHHARRFSMQRCMLLSPSVSRSALMPWGTAASPTALSLARCARRRRWRQ